jgi:hypothetical protein
MRQPQWENGFKSFGTGQIGGNPDISDNFKDHGIYVLFFSAALRKVFGFFRNVSGIKQSYSIFSIVMACGAEFIQNHFFLYL